jgi:hypothetical protein
MATVVTRTRLIHPFLSQKKISRKENKRDGVSRPNKLHCSVRRKETKVKTWKTRIQKSLKKAHTNVTGAEGTQNKNKTRGLYLHEHNRKMYLSIKTRKSNIKEIRSAQAEWNAYLPRHYGVEWKTQAKRAGQLGVSLQHCQLTSPT